MNANPGILLQACRSTVAQRAATAYLAGPELDDALRVCRHLSRHGFASTIGYWNREGDRPREVADACLAAIDTLWGENTKSFLSIKAPTLGFDPDLVAEVTDRARARDLGVHFDSLGPETADQTFSLITGLLPRYSKLGCTLPGRWRRSLGDAQRAVDLRLNVRVVKGQWGDPSEIDPRVGFLAVVDRLSGRAYHVQVATHDAPLAREALRRLRTAGTPCELELLFGFPLFRVVRIGREAQVPIRLYVPYGHAGLPYRLSQAPQNPRIFWWLLRDLLLGHSFRLWGAFLK